MAKTDSVDKMKWNRDVGGLVKALKYEKKSQMRGKAALALGEMRDPSAVGSLIGALDDESGVVRKKAVEALGLIADERAEGPLSRVLKDESLQVRMAVPWALENIKHRVGERGLRATH